LTVAFDEVKADEELGGILSFFEVNTYHGSVTRLKSRLLEWAREHSA
jgi:hypothetical protein